MWNEQKASTKRYLSTLWLLDGDAKKQIEDIIDKEIAVKALNQIYGENTFSRNEFDISKPFIKQVDKKIHENSALGKFDKIKFIETVLRLTDSNNIPDIIKDIIDDCYKLVG